MQGSSREDGGSGRGFLIVLRLLVLLLFHTDLYRSDRKKEQNELVPDLFVLSYEFC